MKPIRVLIVDDLALARRRIVNLLEEVPDVHLVGDCGDGVEAARLLQRRDVDLVFLDIELPGPNGFEFLGGLVHQPFVIFVTGFESYALDAFGVRALDYLLKPFESSRFFEALERARKAIRGARATARTPPNEMLLRVRHRGRMVSIAIADLMWVQAAGNYVSLVLFDRTILQRTTLTSAAKSLPTDAFLRIHRSILVGLRHVRRFHYLGDGRYRVVLVDGRRLVSSRSFKSVIDAHLEGPDFGL